MLKIGILTCEKFRDLIYADQILMNKIIERGYEVSPVVWSDYNDVEKYDVLLFRSTWDYFERKEEFNQWLTSLENKNVLLFNPLHIIQENIHKFYLQKLENQGIKIVPTIFIEKNNAFHFDLPEDWKKSIIKPAYSAGAYKTKVFENSEKIDIIFEYKDFVKENDVLIQKFMPEIISNGETSLIFFNGRYSHSVLKKPKEGDFRVQSIFGGKYEKVIINEQILFQAKHILNLLSDLPLYARVDGIMIENELYLMEVEMIEPDLYIEYEYDAYDRFIDALEERIHLKIT
ncbi:MAG: Cycloserine biosynthesis protein DcsG [Bacteroidota bacterium]